MKATGDPRRLREVSWLGNGKAFVVDSVDYTGLVIVRGALTREEQRRLVRVCLDECSAQNGSNLHTHYKIPAGGLWKAYKEAYHGAPEEPVMRVADVEQGRRWAGATTLDGPRKRVTHEPCDITSLTRTESSPFNDPPSTTVPLLPPSQLMAKMRWSNLGVFYHWPSKRYNLTKETVPVHEHIKRLSLDLVRSLDWDEVYGRGGDGSRGWRDYNVEAGVINFYQPRDSLTAHQDISEADGSRPLVSISLGLDSIFLIGTQSRETTPLAVRLHSGDVVLLSGPVRRAFHALPRVLEGTCPDWLAEQTSDAEWGPYGRFMATTRLNVNVRQVFAGQLGRESTGYDTSSPRA